MLPVLVVVVLGLSATGVLVVLMLGLLRQLRLLTRSLARFQRDVRPAAARITGDGARARERLQAIRERLDQTSGARIRR